MAESLDKHERDRDRSPPSCIDSLNGNGSATLSARPDLAGVEKWYHFLSIRIGPVSVVGYSERRRVPAQRHYAETHSTVQLRCRR
ncbi:hypothetical protein FSOLCH5_003757 [Fusarium solani]